MKRGVSRLKRPEVKVAKLGGFCCPCHLIGAMTRADQGSENVELNFDGDGIAGTVGPDIPDPFFGIDTE